MKHPIIVGLQYGDEGKGKITDAIAGQADWVIRFNGGNNAGHTLWVNGKKMVTHSVPSGVLSKKARNFIGAACVVDPIALKKEVDGLNAAGAELNSDRLRIDHRAHMILPIHRALDAVREAGSHGIGTTKRGIGPTYAAKADRLGVRFEDVKNPGAKEKIKFLCQTYNPLLKAVGEKESSFEENYKCFELACSEFGDYVSYERAPFYDVAKNKRCVLEGAQAAMLDIDHGSFPYVTSSNCIPAYAAVGTPFPVSRLGAAIGVAKAYMTRVGDGPFPTELHGEVGERLRQKGGEFGATTGRPRRVGWINGDELREAVQISDVTYIALTKADILSGEGQVSAWINGKLEHFEGWSNVKDGEKLNANFVKFITRIQNHVGCPILAIGTGADREDIFFTKPVRDFWSL